MSQSSMTPEPDRLIAKLLEGDLPETEREQLNRLLRDDASLRRLYREYMILDALLRWEIAPPLMRVGEEGCGTRGRRRGMAGSPATDASVGPTVEHPVGAAVELPHQHNVELPHHLDLESQIPNPPFPLLTTTHYPLPADFVGSWTFACMVATVIVGAMLLGFWAIKITPHQHIAEAPSPASRSIERPEFVFVGRITGLLDVKWSDDEDFLPPHGYAYVPLGHKYKLDSGLMEITYDSGAKVILQGPCTYEVESTAGGYLSLGKLTAKVEKERSEVRSQRSDHYPLSTNSNPQSPIPNPLFSVRTPTAIVTDLGTEFGVEVDETGVTESHVFRGSVKMLVLDGTGNPPSPSGRGAGGEGSGQVVVLRANESARVDGGDEPRVTVLGPSTKTADFIRRIPEVTYKTLDLVDVVASGDGFSGRRGRGIDPTNGRIVDALPALPGPTPAVLMTGDGQYHRVAGMPFIDGAFIPDGGKDEVQTDSAGHVFAGFRDTANTAALCLWAGGAFPDQRYPSKFGGVDYASSGHGLLFMHANIAITFDLEAIRRANPDYRRLQFRAVAANIWTEYESYPDVADVWVLVDGRSRFQRQRIGSGQGIFSVLVPIHDKDRFLTLAATDGGDGTSHDWIIFGDPRLELLLPDADEQKEKGGQTMNGP